MVFRHPSEKWWSSSVGIMIFPIYGKIIQMFQTTNQKHQNRCVSLWFSWNLGNFTEAAHQRHARSRDSRSQWLWIRDSAQALSHPFKNGWNMAKMTPQLMVIFMGKYLVLLGKPVDLQQVHEWFDHGFLPHRPTKLGDEPLGLKGILSKLHG